MKSLVMGASAGVGRALSEALAARGDSLLLISSDISDLNALAAHLRLVFNAEIQVIEADAAQPEICLEKIRLALNFFSDVDAVFLPIGFSRPDDNGGLTILEIQHIINVNLIVVMGVIGYLLPKFLSANKGHIVGFGSVASLRGRRVNVVYSAAKRGLESYFESLFHLTAFSNIRIQFYKLGYVETTQSFGKKLLLPIMSPNKVSKTVISNLGRNSRIIYLPRYWVFISKLLPLIPWPIFKRLNF